MKGTEIETAYISRACNRLPRAADWGRNNLVCYAANNAIAIYNPTAAGGFGLVLSTLHLHTKRVNLVRWIKPKLPKLETELMSASSDGTAVIWEATNLESGQFKAKDILRVNKPVNISDALYLPTNPNNLLVCTGSTEGDLQLWWRLGNQAIEQIQTLNLKQKLPIEARFAILPTSSNDVSNLLLLVAIEDSTVQLYSTFITDGYIKEKKFEDFTKVQTLIGHEDWVISIDYILSNDRTLLVATSSQDCTIRLWNISQSLNAEDAKSDEKNIELKTKKQNFVAHNEKYEIVLESILIGHDAWVYEVHWHPPLHVNGKCVQSIQLLSCSLDKTAIIWKPSNNAGIWSETVRVGEVGGNSLGFYGCKFGPTGKSILAYSYHGSFHLWECKENGQLWKPRTAITGHYSDVVDLSWDPKGRFFFTTSTDQTTRIHAPWPVGNGQESWHEISRPQIHGYDMSCLAIVKPCIFASGAEEKVVRLFTAPVTFRNYLEKIVDDISDFDAKTLAEAASVPSLGLTNKSIFDGKSDQEVTKDLEDINYNEPPFEDVLVRQTLWPELQKLYGHGYEIFAMASRHDGTVLATSCKSTAPEHAAIILWNTKTWHQIQKLFSHHLTVTQLSFSPNDKYLLSVSRDRRWSLFTLQNNKYELLISSTQKNSLHTRIIWCCAWTIDSNYFATGSRDGKIGIWSTIINSDTPPSPVTQLHLSDMSVTALTFAPLNIENTFSYILAIGFENGCIEIRKIHKIDNSNSFEWMKLAFLDTSNAHHLTVKRLAFRPSHKNEQKNIIQLASCGSDGVVKLHKLTLS